MSTAPPVNTLGLVRAILGAPGQAEAELRARLDEDPGSVRCRLEVSLDGGGKRGLERAARRLGLEPAALLAMARAEVDPDVPPGVLPEVYP